MQKTVHGEVVRKENESNLWLKAILDFHFTLYIYIYMFSL